MSARTPTDRVKRAKGQQVGASPDLEQEHRELLRDFVPVPVVVTAPPPKVATYEVRHFTTYSAFEDPIMSD